MLLLRLHVWLVISGFTNNAVAAPPKARRDADFKPVRTRLSRSRSGGAGDAPEKYFHESSFDPHYDGRFAAKVIPYEERHLHLTALIQTYLLTMSDIGAETWLMHGSLLGWWWNKNILPWDSDIDVQISEESMHLLADHYNMTAYHFPTLRGIPGGRDYLLEINPNYLNSSTDDKQNAIDARWIDTDTGLFIDVTALRKDQTARDLGFKGAMMCKDEHFYLYDDIFPLRDSVFENEPVKIPFAYSKLLEEEYGREALTDTRFENHVFDTEKMAWFPLEFVVTEIVDVPA